MSAAAEVRRRNLAKGTPVRQARARMKRALAAGEAAAADVVAGTSTWEETAGPMPLEQLLRACGADPVDVLHRANALELRAYRTHTITTERRREIAGLLEN